MTEKSIEDKVDSEVLGALFLLSSKNKLDGLKYLELVKAGCLSGAITLYNKGYAQRYKNPKEEKDDNVYYRLNKKGFKFLTRIVELANKEFYIIEDNNSFK